MCELYYYTKDEDYDELMEELAPKHDRWMAHLLEQSPQGLIERCQLCGRMFVDKQVAVYFYARPLDTTDSNVDGRIYKICEPCMDKIHDAYSRYIISHVGSDSIVRDFSQIMQQFRQKINSYRVRRSHDE